MRYRTPKWSSQSTFRKELEARGYEPTSTRFLNLIVPHWLIMGLRKIPELQVNLYHWEMIHGRSAPKRGPLKWPQGFVALTKARKYPWWVRTVRGFNLCAQKHRKDFDRSSAGRLISEISNWRQDGKCQEASGGVEYLTFCVWREVITIWISFQGIPLRPTGEDIYQRRGANERLNIGGESDLIPPSWHWGDQGHSPVRYIACVIPGMN